MGSFYELLDKWYCPSSKSKLKLSWPYFQLLSISLSPRTINILKEWCTVVSLLCHLASTSQSIPIIFWYVHSPWIGALYNFLTFQILKSSLCFSLLLSLCLPQNSTEIINSTFLKKTVANLQCCISFKCTAKWFSYIYIYNMCTYIYCIYIDTHIYMFFSDYFPLLFIRIYWM